jgi:hypothetical protein
MNVEFKTLYRAVFMHNEYYRIAAPIVRFVDEVSKSFIGKKITTVKDLTVKFKEAIKIDRKSIDVQPLPGTKWANLHSYLVTVDGSHLSVKISLCFSDGTTGCYYEQNTYYIGNVSTDGILLSLNHLSIDREPLDYSIELEKIKHFRKLEAEAQQAKDQIKVGLEAYQYLHLSDFE